MVNFVKDIQKREFDSTGQFRTMQFAFVNPNSGGDTQVVPVQTGLRIIVLEVCIITSLAQYVRLRSGTNDISCAWPLATNGGLVLPYSRHGWAQTNIGEPLNINLSGGGATGIQIGWCPSL